MAFLSLSLGGSLFSIGLRALVSGSVLYPINQTAGFFFRCDRKAWGVVSL
jgi:hypothetical protein